MLNLIGMGGHAKVVLDACIACGLTHGQIVMRDKNIEAPDDIFENCEIGSPETSPDMQDQDFHLAIGNNVIRSKLYGEVIGLGGKPYSILHPNADISSNAEVGAASFAASGSIIAAKAKVGTSVIVNHNSVVDHDCVIGDFCHIAPGVILGGEVSVGARVLIGSGAVILPGIAIGSDVIIGAGAVVTKPVPDSAKWIGTSIVRGS